MSRQVVVSSEQIDKNVRTLRTPPLEMCHRQQFLSPQAVKHIYDASPTIRRPLQVIHSPRNFSTPKKLNDASSKETSSIISYSYKALPKFATPPSQTNEFVVTNPFDADLKNKLHLPIFSPSVFNTCISPSKESQESFCWTIDDLSNIHPAPIDEKFSDIAQVFSPETESRTQQAIDSYFCTTNVLQSPWPANSQGRKKSFQPSLTSEAEQTDDGDATTSSLNDASAPSNGQACNAWTQTELSLPPVLPAELEEALKPYFTFTQEQQSLTPDSGLDSSSSRRKLFEPRATLSPVQKSSPLKRGVLYWPNLLLRGAMLCDSPALTRRDHGSPLPGQRGQRSPSVSPVHAGTPPPAPPSQRKSSASARLDFSDESMQVDRSFSVRYSFDGEDCAMSSYPATPTRNSQR